MHQHLAEMFESVVLGGLDVAALVHRETRFFEHFVERGGRASRGGAGGGRQPASRRPARQSAARRRQSEPFMKYQPAPAAASTATTMPIIITQRLAGLLLATRARCSREPFIELSASAVEEMRAASLTARSIGGGLDRRVDERVDRALEHQCIDHAGGGAVADRDDHRVVRAAGDRREVLGSQPAQVGDENRARAGFEHVGGGGEAVGVAQQAGGFEHGPELAPTSRGQAWR